MDPQSPQNQGQGQNPGNAQGQQPQGQQPQGQQPVVQQPAQGQPVQPPQPTPLPNQPYYPPQGQGYNPYPTQPNQPPMPPAGVPPNNQFPGGQTPPPGAYPQYPPQVAYPQQPAQQSGAYAQPGAYPPAGPQGGFPPQPGAYGQPGFPPAGAPPVQQPEDNTPANFQLATKLPAKLNVPVPKHTLNFDEEYFIRLLAGSISLSKDEKKKIIESIPKLRQEQIDELIRIFEEEKQKFAALSQKHVPQLEKLAVQHYQEWMDLEADYKLQDKKKEDENQADAIRKQLGL